MLDLLALAAFAGLLFFAACCDVASLTIPNWVSSALAALFPLAALASGAALGDVAWHLAFGIGVLAIGFVLFQLNILGGGDAKLLAAGAVWTGMAAFPTFIFWTAATGGVLALILVAARQFLNQAEAYPTFVNRLLQKQDGIPYGVAILGGGLMAIPALPLAQSLLTAP